MRLPPPAPYPDPMTAAVPPSGPKSVSPPEQRPPGSGALAVLRIYLGPLWWRVLLLAVLLFTATGLNLILPQLLRQFVDGAKLGAAAPVAQLAWLAGVYIGVAVGVQLLTASATYVGARVGWRATNRLRADLMAHLLSLDMHEHKERTPGEMIERIDGDVTALSNFFSQFAVRVFGAALLLIGAIVMFYRENVWIGLGITAFVVVTLIAMNRVRKAGVEPTRLERESSAKLFGFIEERLAGLDDVRSLGAGPHHLNRFLKVQREYFGRSTLSWRRRSVVWQLSMALFAAGYVAILVSAVGLYFGGRDLAGYGLFAVPVHEHDRGTHRSAHAAASGSAESRGQPVPGGRTLGPALRSAGRHAGTSGGGLAAGLPECGFQLRPLRPHSARRAARRLLHPARRTDIWACWGAPAAAKPPSRASYRACTIPPGAACNSRASTPANSS